MLKFLIILMVFLFVATPLVGYLSFHDDCADQVCHMLMINLFILTPAIIVLAVFFSIQLISKMASFETLCSSEVFLPPRFS